MSPDQAGGTSEGITRKETFRRRLALSVTVSDCRPLQEATISNRRALGSGTNRNGNPSVASRFRSRCIGRKRNLLEPGPH